MPFFSIIIPTLNSSKTLTIALGSVLQQSFMDFEILIMDGLSTDTTIEIAQRFVDKRIKIFSEKDNGIYDAMNKGIQLSKGEWLYFMGSDDALSDPNKLKELSTILSSDIDMIYGNVIWGNTGKIYDGIFDLEKLIRYKNICQQAIFYNKNVFLKMGLFRNEFKYCADHYFNIQCFISGLKINYIDKIIAIYNNEGRSSLMSDEDFQKERTMLIIQKFENPIEVYDKFKKYNQQINICENSKEYKLGRLLLYPMHCIFKKIKKFLKR